MKFIIAIMFILSSLTAFSYDVPQDAVIKVFTADGTQIGEMSRSEYKVVKLGTSNEGKIQSLTKLNSVLQTQVSNPSIKDVKAYKSFIFHAGTGYKGVRQSRASSSTFKVTEQHSTIFGATGCASSKGKGVCASAFTNETLQLGFKLDID